MDNYKYQKTLHVMNNIDYIDFDNLLLVQSNELDSPIAVLYYEYYNNMSDVQFFLDNYCYKIQCVVSKDSWIQNSVPFGNAQTPTLHDFPDNVDVMKFILSK